ncbi:MAG: hypothetical protein KBG15_20950 [Kofleriaceae bacterium]|nr:hypothetical protein [Kofleriaceae bacterium]
MSNEQPLPSAIVASAGGLKGSGPSTKHKRKLSNFLIDKKLQLRYIIVVVVISAIIAGVLGYLIYQQERQASAALDAGLEAYGLGEVAQDLAAKDSALIYKMIGVGIGLAAILAMFLLIMTHKVAGPLFKVSMYFDRMAVGRLSVVTPLRQGDMLHDFFETFQHMHEAVRARQLADVETMSTAIQSIGTHDGMAVAVAELERHVASRSKLLS